MSRVNSTIQGPTQVPDGRIDGRGLTFNSPLAAIGESFESLGALGNQMAVHYKKIHDANVAKKAQVEFDLRIEEAALALDAAPNAEAFNTALAAESEALASLADEMVGRVDGPQLREQMMADMNLRSGKFGIRARGALFKLEEAEFLDGLTNDLDDFREAGDYEAAIAHLSAEGPLALPPERVRAMVSALEHERDLSAASIAVENYREGSGDRPSLDQYTNLGWEDRLRLRRQLSSVSDHRAGRVSSASLSNVVDDLVGRGVPLSEGLSNLRGLLESSGLEGDELDLAVSALEDDYMVTEIGLALSRARRDGTLESYREAMAFVQDARFESSPDALEAAGAAAEYLRRGMNSLSLGDESDRSFVREASLRIAPVFEELLSENHVSYRSDGSVVAPTEEAFRKAMAEAIGFDTLNLPVLSTTGELIAEGDISVSAMHGAQSLIDDAWEQYRTSIEDAAPPTLWDLSVSPASNPSPGARAQMLDQHWQSVGLDVGASPSDIDERALQIYIEAMNTQKAIPSPIATGFAGGYSGLEANATFHENLALLRREGLSSGAFSSFREQGMDSEAAYQRVMALNDAFMAELETAESPAKALEAARNSVSNASELDAGDAFLREHAPGTAPAFEQTLVHRGLSLVDEEGKALDADGILASVESAFLEDAGLGDSADEPSRFVARAMAGAWLDALRDASQGKPLRLLTRDEMAGLISQADAAVSDLGFGSTRYASAGESLSLALHPAETMYGVVGRGGGLTRTDSVLLPTVTLPSDPDGPRSTSYIGEESIRQIMVDAGPELSSVIGPSLGAEASSAYGRLRHFWTAPAGELSSVQTQTRSAVRELNLFHASVAAGLPDARLEHALRGYSRGQLVSIYNELGGLIRDVVTISDRLSLSPQADLASPDDGRAERQISGAAALNLPRTQGVSQVQYEATFIGEAGESLPYSASGVQPYYERSLLYYQDLIGRRLHTLAGQSAGGRLLTGLGEGVEGLTSQGGSEANAGRGDLILNMAPAPGEFDLAPPGR